MIFLECMLKGGDVPAGLVCRVERQRVRLILEWFSAMATDEELVRIKDRHADSGARRIDALVINDHVRARLAQAVRDSGAELPPGLRKGKQLGSSTIYSQLAQLKTKPAVNREDFLAFRTPAVVAEAADSDPEPEPEDEDNSGPAKRARTSQEGASSSTSPLRRFMGMFNAA